MATVMYAVYRTKRKSGDNTPVAFFASKDKAEAYKEHYAPSWLRRRWWIGRVVVNRIDITAYEIRTHLGYRTREVS